MNRLAISTEGETEQLFAEWLVREMVSAANLQIELRRARGGKSTRRRTRIVEARNENPAVKYYVLIVDCGGDGGVKSRILEEYHRLAEYRYKAIIGLRDAPKQREDIPRLRQGLLEDVPVALERFLFACHKEYNVLRTLQAFAEVSSCELFPTICVNESWRL